MAALVGNLCRRLDEFTNTKLHRDTKVHLDKIQRYLSRLQPFLDDAEWKRQLHEAEWMRGRQVYCGERYCKISKWVSRVEALVTEVYDVIVTYDLHLCNMNAPPLYNKLHYYYFFVTSPDSVYAKIHKFLSTDQQSTATFSRWVHPNDLWKTSRQKSSSLSDDSVPLLGSPPSFSSEYLTSWLNGLLGMDMLELLQDFTTKVIGEISSLTSEASHDLCLISQLDLITTVSNQDSGKAVQTILESVSLVGRHTEEIQLESWLLADINQESISPVLIVGVTGVPGIGKTSLVAAIYDRVKLSFDCHAWIFVSPNLNSTSFLKNVLRCILKSMSVMVPSDMDSLDKETLKEMIHRLLMGKRKFLLVLDDVPRQDKDLVSDYVTLLALPHGCKAKIICTSRKSSAAYQHVLDLQPLSPHDAFNLLQKRSCLGQEGSSLWASVKSERDVILNVCDGLPLAIATIGGMLSTKQMKSQGWNIVHQKLKEARYVALSFISLSYADLNPVLKSCFLYAASFPYQYEISCKRLQRLWISEGFIQNVANMTLEEVAKLQLHQLIQRNMIQCARVGTDGSVETCRVLGPIRDYALARSQRDHHFRTTTVESIGDRNAFIARRDRLVLQAENNGNFSLMDRHHRLNLGRLITFISLSKLDIDQPLFVRFKLLSVLEIKELPADTLPSAIGDLVLLRYMSLRGTKLKTLPSSFKNLQRLETLDIRDTLVRDLPAGLENLAMLRHLLLAGSYSDTIVDVKVKINVLKNLQTLSGLKLTEKISQGLQYLPLIEKLSAGNANTVDSQILFESIGRLDFLRSLTIKCSKDKQKIDMASCKPHYNLEKLKFGGPVSNLLRWVSKLQSLKYLYLWDNTLGDDPFSSLEHLPNLVLLSLCNAYDGEEIQFGERGFMKLRKLSILHCRNLKQWTEIKEGAMANLQMLTIAYCPKLLGPPKGLKKLKSLQALQLSSMPAQFINQTSYIHLSSNFSLQIRDTTHFSAAAAKRPSANKRIPVLRPPHQLINKKSSSSSSSSQGKKLA